MLNVWAAAHQNLVQAELRVVEWELHCDQPVPTEMQREVERLRAESDWRLQQALRHERFAS